MIENLSLKELILIKGEAHLSKFNPIENLSLKELIRSRTLGRRRGQLDWKSILKGIDTYEPVCEDTK